MIKPGTIIKVTDNAYIGKNRKKSLSKGDFLYVSYKVGHFRGYCYGCNTTGNLHTVVLSASQFEIMSEDLIELYDSNKAEFLKKFDEIKLLYRL